MVEVLRQKLEQIESEHNELLSNTKEYVAKKKETHSSMSTQITYLQERLDTVTAEKEALQERSRKYVTKAKEDQSGNVTKIAELTQELQKAYDALEPLQSKLSRVTEERDTMAEKSKKYVARFSSERDTREAEQAERIKSLEDKYRGAKADVVEAVAQRDRDRDRAVALNTRLKEQLALAVEEKEAITLRTKQYVHKVQKEKESLKAQAADSPTLVKHMMAVLYKEMEEKIAPNELFEGNQFLALTKKHIKSVTAAFINPGAAAQ
jgi:chromosome segregation ATPase